jgi:hypothetical protein
MQNPLEQFVSICQKLRIPRIKHKAYKEVGPKLPLSVSSIYKNMQKQRTLNVWNLRQQVAGNYKQKPK